MQLRLRKTDRDALVRFARKLVTPDEELVAAERAAYKAAKRPVMEAVRKRFPLRDMKVLKKYDKALPDSCIKVTALDDRPVTQFDFDRDDAPLVAEPTYRTPPYEITPEGYEAVVAWTKAKEAREDDYQQRIDDYSAFIAGCRTFEQVLEVWPEADELRDAVEAGRSTLPVSMDVLERVRNDAARRLEEAA